MLNDTTELILCVKERNACQPNIFVMKLDDYNSSKYIDDGLFDANKFHTDNPNLEIVYAFDAETELHTRQIDEKLDFEHNCEQYGFKPSDYDRIFKTRYTTYVFKGFLPRNTKYKARLLNLTNNRRTKATLDFVRLYIGA